MEDDTNTTAPPALPPASGTRIFMVIVAGAALTMWAMRVEGPALLAGVTIPFICSVLGWRRSRRKVLGSVAWAVASGFFSSLIFGGFIILWSLGRKPTGPYQSTDFIVVVAIFGVVMSLVLGVVIGLLVAAGFWLAGVRPAARDPRLNEDRA